MRDDLLLYYEREYLRSFDLTAEQERFCSTAFEGYTREELLTLLTRTMCRQPDRGAGGQQSLPRGLTEEERSLRDIAFSRLARKELLILLTRRLWSSLLRWSPPGRR